MPQYPVSPAKTSPLPTKSETAWEQRAGADLQLNAIVKLPA
jgi:hypothetical protein